MPSPDSHLHHHPTSTPSRPDPAWKRWSAAWTRQARTLTGRPDLTVVVAPGAGHGSPACYLPGTATIEVDAALIGHPGIADPRRPGHKKSVPVGYGALVHEAAHAAHTRWRPPNGIPPVLAAVAAMLEESRAELAHRRRRPRDRQWLRHAVRAIVDPADTPTDHPWHAAWAAGLLLARADARTLTARDVAALRRTATRILGTRRLRALRRIWQTAHTVADHDADTMTTLARRWCHLLGVDPDTHPHLPSPPGRPGAVAAAVAATVAALHPRPADEPEPGGPDRHTDTGLPAGWTTRPATPAEHAAAAALAAALRRARTREPVTTTRPSPLPPGRLRPRAAVAAAAQHAAGTPVTAQPWQRTTRRPVPDPTLAIAVLVDVSGSMHAFAQPLSSAAWILAHAAARAGATCTTIAFGDTVTVLVPPGRPPTLVRQMRADAGTEAFDDAVQAADRLLHLTTPDAVRLLAVVSDGWFADRPAAQHTIDRLLNTGCAILWLTPAGRPHHTYTGPTTVAVADPAASAAIIGRAAARALAAR